MFVTSSFFQGLEFDDERETEIRRQELLKLEVEWEQISRLNTSAGAASNADTNSTSLEASVTSVIISNINCGRTATKPAEDKETVAAAADKEGAGGGGGGGLENKSSADSMRTMFSNSMNNAASGFATLHEGNNNSSTTEGKTPSIQEPVPTSSRSSSRPQSAVQAHRKNSNPRSASAESAQFLNRSIRLSNVLQDSAGSNGSSSAGVTAKAAARETSCNS